jgi:hypothetical protein
MITDAGDTVRNGDVGQAITGKERKTLNIGVADRSKTAHFPEAETSSDADSRHGRYQ